MKTLTAFAALLFAASQLSAQTADKPTVITPADLKQTDPKAGPVAPTPVKKEVKKPAPEPIIPGQIIARPNGTLLGLQLVDGKFKLSFYDSKKKPMAVDVTRAAARWPNPRAVGDNHTVLEPSGTALVGAKTVVAPFNFNLTLVLLQGEGEVSKAVETYVVLFRG